VTERDGKTLEYFILTFFICDFKSNVILKAGHAICRGTAPKTTIMQTLLICILTFDFDMAHCDWLKQNESILAMHQVESTTIK
jgi:hypothetical protein